MTDCDYPVPPPLLCRVPSVRSRARLDRLALIALRSARVATAACVITSAVSASARRVTSERGRTVRAQQRGRVKHTVSTLGDNHTRTVKYLLHSWQKRIRT